MSHNKTFAEHPKSKNWSSKNKVSPIDIPYGYYKKFWFDCDKCSHDFETNINSVANLGTWCPYCGGKKICDNNNCNECFEKSFASHEKSKYWSKNNNKNPRTIFKSTAEKFLFDCNKCKKEFSISPNNITNGKWCKDCGYKSMVEKVSLKIDDFLEKAKETHGDKYDYSKVIMNGVDRNIIIICKIHGEFQQTPYNHYGCGNGCTLCGFIKRADSKRYTQEEFINKANEIHNNKYDYSKVKYIDSQTSIIIICKLHGEFNQEASSHLGGCGCKKCGEISAHDKQRLTTEEFIIRAKEKYGDIYDYSKSNWISGHTEITITCKTHGDFLQDPFNHLKGHGCKRCTYICNLEDFIDEANKIHNNLYDYSECIYEKSIRRMKIICKKCGIFEQSANSHLDGAGCPTCKNKTEQKLYLYLKSKYPLIKTQFKLENCKFKRYLPFDFCIPNKKIIIELDGGQHFKKVRNWDDPEKTIKKDVFKMQKAKLEGYKVIRISQEDVYKKNNEEWLNKKLITAIEDNNKLDVFISTIDSLYDEHIKLINSGIEIILTECNTEDSNESEMNDNKTII